MKNITIAIGILFLFTKVGLLAQDSNNVTELTDGLTFTDGVFYPTFSIQGMTYNPQTKSYEVAIGSPSGGSTALPDPAPFLAAYNALGTLGEKKSYFSSLSTAERASLFGELSSEDKPQMLETFNDLSSSPAYYQGKTGLSAFLSVLPAGQAGAALNLMQKFEGVVYPGAPDYYGSTMWDPYEDLNLSGVNLVGWNPALRSLKNTNLAGSTGFTASMFNDLAAVDGIGLAGFDLTGFNFGLKNLYNAKFNNSNITVDQLNSAASITYANLSGVQTLAGWDSTGKSLAGVNFVGSNVEVQTLNSSIGFAAANLSGRNLTGLVTTGKSIAGANFSGSNISVAQIQSSSDWSWADLSGLDLTGLDTVGRRLNGINFSGSTISVSQLNNAMSIDSANLSGRDLIGLETTNKWLMHNNFSNSNITINQLMQAFAISGVNLVGTGITRPALEAAIADAGKTGQWNWSLEQVSF